MSPFVASVASVRNTPRFARLLGMLALAACSGCHDGGPATALAELDQARSLAADLRVQFNKANDASNRAVMADTDEASTAFAHDAQSSRSAVDTDKAALAPVLQRLGFTNETQLLEQFSQHLSEYRAVDDGVLTLAVENTNLKAQHLSFGPAREAADRFRDSLVSFGAALSKANHCAGDALIAQAVSAVRQIQALHAPHIAEANDAAMTALEKTIAEQQAAARGAVDGLSGLADASARDSLAPALAALDQFKTLSDQILALSRQNTNVRSLDLALRVKPPLATACDASLGALSSALANEGSKATR